jgi:hypothetical protein
MDSSFFKTSISACNKVCDTLIRSHPGKDVMKLIFGNLFVEAWGSSTAVVTVSDDFRACDVCPVSRHAVSEAEMASTDVVLTISISV